jgi:hypothetical protein
MKRTILFAAGFLVGSLFFISCENDDSMVAAKSKAKLEVRLTDDPADYDAVYIDVQDVQINVSGDSASEGWQSLQGVNKGVYNLLDLVNDKDTLLAVADIPSGRLSQMRLILGPDNSVVVDGIEYELKTPSAQQSGLKLNIHQDVTAGVLYTILLDFDVAKSVHQTGNKKFMLKPVIRTVLTAAGLQVKVGDISGFVVPDSVLTTVLAIQGPDTVASTFTDSTGGYMIKGLNAGLYDLHYVPGDTTWKKNQKTGIIVNARQVTVVDTVFLQK